MNIKKVEKSIRKISQVVDNIKEEGIVSKIEKDLLLSYIRDLYEKVSDSESSSVVTEKKKSKAPEAPVEKASPISVQAKTVEMSEVVRQELQEPLSVIQPSQGSTPNPSPEVSDAYTRTSVQVEPEPLVAAVATNSAPAELLELFDEAVVSELSDKLSRAPISDLTKCMGINERIFTVNELFGGNTDLFNSAMHTMNGFSSLEQARDYLVDSVAVDQNWSSDYKLKKAANFVKLISRRY